MTVERLRKWLLAGAILLVMVVFGFLFYAKWRAHRFLTDLPAKLGADVRQETNAFTYSQTVKGKTVFTLHSAKAIQHKDGKYTLHDVGIAVYGHGEVPQESSAQTGQERVDRIYGKEFDLDEANGVIKAVGEVHLDLEAPAAKDSAGKMDYAAGKDLKPSEAKEKIGATDIHEVGLGDSRLIHVKTSNLVYLKKLGVAATDEEIEFEYNGLTGHAKGAEYNADTGVLVLQQAVKVSGIEKGKPILLTAGKAELDRNNHRVVLNEARYLTVGEGNDASAARQQVAAHHAVVSLREDGDVDKIEGDGGVTLTAGDGLRMTGDRGSVALKATGKPVSAHVVGNVKYAADDEQRHAQGSSSEAKVDFDKAGDARNVLLSGNVDLTDRVKVRAKTKSAASAGWSERHLSAPSVEMALVNEAGKSRLQQARATGGAKLHVVDSSPDGKRQTTEMAADVLTAQFAAGQDGASRLDSVLGNGRTSLARTLDTGVVETSSGDSLEAHLRDGGTRSGPGTAGANEISTAVQQGNVVLSRRTPTKKDASGKETAEQVERATASKVSFDGASHRAELTGKVQLSGVDQTLWAERVTIDQITGDSTAVGGIKASYRQSAQADAIHVLADHAELNKADGVAVFHGSPRTLARLWQGGSQVEARVLEFNQKLKSLKAHGDGTGAPMAVRTVLVSRGAADVPAAGALAQKKEASRKPVVVRIASREMTYSDPSRQAEFTGGVRVESADGVMRGERADVLLEASDAKKQVEQNLSNGTSFMGGSVERVNVEGGIEISQQGRRATGEKLVYTTSDGLFVLTGTPSDAPRVVDQLRGVVTGEELRFRAADESIVISNGNRSGSGPRVHTETKVKRDR